MGSMVHRKPSVHDVAFMNGIGPRLHHIAYWLSDQMTLIQACDVLALMGYTENIERGPARHGISNAFFLYCETQRTPNRTIQRRLFNK